MTEYLYKSLCAGFKSYHGKKTWTPGKWHSCRGDLEMCVNGLHASKRIVDAMRYVPMEILAKVEVRGESIQGDDKSCHREMRIVKAWRWEKKDSVAMAIYCAGLVIKNFEDAHPGDKRPREAIEAARRWLKNPTEENRQAALSAEYAARSASEYADRAARSAAAAARAETLDRIEAWIRRRVRRLEVMYD